MAETASGTAKVLRMPWVKPPGREAASKEQPQSSYGEVFERISERLRRGERMAAMDRVRAPLLYAELMAQPPVARRKLFGNGHRFASYLLAEMLLEKSRESWFDDAQEALELAELGLATAEMLDEEGYDSSLLSSLRARAWSYLANARRLNVDLAGAEEAFGQVEELLGEAVIDPYQRAEILSLRISLLGDQGDYVRASELMDEILAIYRAAGDRRQLGRALIQKAALVNQGWHAGEGRGEELAQVVEMLREGLAAVDASRETSLVVCARQNLAVALHGLGQVKEGWAELGRAQELCEQVGNRLNLLRLRWTFADLAAAEGQYAQAEEAYQEVRRAFGGRGMDYEAARVALDLARLYTQQGRSDKTRELAQQMLPVFRGRGLERDTLAALILFCRAAERDRVTLDLLRDLAARIERSQARAGQPASMA